jgi:hypothetical protein
MGEAVELEVQEPVMKAAAEELGPAGPPPMRDALCPKVARI